MLLKLAKKDASSLAPPARPFLFFFPPALDAADEDGAGGWAEASAAIRRDCRRLEGGRATGFFAAAMAAALL